MNVILITGFSGAGKSTVLHVFEDMKMMTTDGLPPSLAPELARLCAASSPNEEKDLALSLDQRFCSFADELSRVLTALKRQETPPTLLFLEASKDVLMRRYATTRRPHPLERNGVGLEQAIEEEAERLLPVRRMADIVIDTSSYSVHDLRREIQRRWKKGAEHAHDMKINLVSFGFKYGVPHEADLVFDLRFLPNPYFVDALRSENGTNPAVRDYIFATPQAQEFQKRFTDFMNFSLPLYEAEGRYRLSIALGCTGGRHRSVAVTEALAAELRKQGYSVSVEHRHVNLG